MNNEETSNPAAPPWVGQLSARLGPDPSLVDVAVQIMAASLRASLPSMSSEQALQALPRLCVDLAADVVRECKQAEIRDPKGDLLADLQVCNQGLYWATINSDLADPTTLCARTRPAIEARVRAHLEEHMKPKGPGPHLPGVIRGGEA